MPRITGLAHTWGALRLPDASKKDKSDDPEAFAPTASLVAFGLPRPPLSFSVGTVLAPMVNQCDIPFRRLCVAFGAKVVYTQMLLAADVVRDADTGLRETLGAHFSPDGDGAPVVAQIAGDCPVAMANAARALAPYCAAVDINLGCPQDAAKAGHYGAWLCKERKDWPLVGRIVNAVASTGVLCFCKVRLQDSPGATMELAHLLQAAGCSLLAIHGRKLGSTKHRRAGPADLDAIAAVRAALSIPVIENGNVRCHADIHANTLKTGCDGVMVGEAALRSPAVFSCPLASCGDAAEAPVVSGLREAVESSSEAAAAAAAAAADSERPPARFKRPRVEFTAALQPAAAGGGPPSRAPVSLADVGARWLAEASASMPPSGCPSAAPLTAYTIAVYLRLCLGRLSCSVGRAMAAADAPRSCSSSRGTGGAERAHRVDRSEALDSTDCAAPAAARSAAPVPVGAALAAVPTELAAAGALPPPLAALALQWPPHHITSSGSAAPSAAAGAPAWPEAAVPLRHILQHVGNFLGKSGRGPGVQYAFLGGPFRRPSDLRDALQQACSVCPDGVEGAAVGGCSLGPSVGGGIGGEEEVGVVGLEGAVVAPELGCRSGGAADSSSSAPPKPPSASFLDEPGSSSSGASTSPHEPPTAAAIALCIARLAGVLASLLPVAAPASEA